MVDQFIKINLQKVRLPGWLWIALAALIIYLGRTYITDSGLVELLVTVVFAAVKALDLNSAEVEKTVAAISTLDAYIHDLRQRVPSPPAQVGHEGAMRSAAPPLPPAPTVEVEQPSKMSTWMLG